MALSKTPVLADLGGSHCVQTSATSALDALTASGGSLFKVEIDNTANSSAVYLKLCDLTSTVTVGSTDPSYVFMCPASQTRVYSCAKGAVYTNGMQAACVTTGGTAGNSNPTNPVIYRILLS